MIIVRQFSPDINTTYSAGAKVKGMELQALIDAAELKVGRIEDMNGNPKTAILSDTAKLEAALAKAGFAQDSNGLWFHEGVHVPAPTQLLNQTPIKRYQQAAV